VVEEGDGVALFEGGDLLAVIPGWSNMSKGMPGYSRDVIGQTPFGWSLDDAMDGLGPRVTEASDFWRWRLDPQAWAQFQQGMLGHMLARLGPGARYWDVSGNSRPVTGVERPPAGRRSATGGEHRRQSCQRMPGIEQSGPEAMRQNGIELAVATTLASNQAARIFLWLATATVAPGQLAERQDHPLVPRAVIVPARQRQRGHPVPRQPWWLLGPRCPSGFTVAGGQSPGSG
jgi:hypothetical protein